MFYDSDIEVYFDEFAQDAIYVHLGGRKSIKCIFDAPGSILVIRNIGVQITDYRITIKSSDIATPRQGDTVIIGGITYGVVSYDDDGTGIIIITLTK